MNIVDQIGVKYRVLGIQLLEDATGAITNAIENEYLRNAADINIKIFQRWFEGQGRKPISWPTLINVLKEIELFELACEIERNL